VEFHRCGAPYDEHSFDARTLGLGRGPTYLVRAYRTDGSERWAIGRYRPGRCRTGSAPLPPAMAATAMTATAMTATATAMIVVSGDQHVVAFDRTDVP
jgi:hypothetical protein